MRINCVGLADLLCAYADGELNDANKQLVEDHLAICDNCTSILKVYREISTSINDTSIEPPTALVKGVMDRVMEESVPRVEKETVERKRNKLILTRYLPVAACLVAMLLVWQFWGNTLFTGRVNDMGSTIAPMEAMPTPVPADAGGGSSRSEALEIKPGTTGGMSEQGGEPSADFNVTDTDDEALDHSSQKENEDAQFLDILNNAYAEIKIKGDLPTFLVDHEPHPIGKWFDWDIVFEIPATDIQALLDELSKRDDFSFERINTESKYAIVFYSP